MVAIEKEWCVSQVCWCWPLLMPSTDNKPFLDYLMGLFVTSIPRWHQTIQNLWQGSLRRPPGGTSVWERTMEASRLERPLRRHTYKTVLKRELILERHQAIYDTFFVSYTLNIKESVHLHSQLRYIFRWRRDFAYLYCMLCFIICKSRENCFALMS